ncbi:MAG TPA: ABC transporter ATP-binding protein [Bryobacteraceae bacterium]|nr:ABC transporter ATP-binding protein [Bryobacteraceae bacterium]
MPKHAAAVSLHGVSKRYRNLLAVHDLTLEVTPGEILGFLGPNGAGKTSTIRVLLDLIRPTTGQAFIFGHDCQASGIEARALAGYLPGEMGVYSDMAGREVLDLLGGLTRQPVRKQYQCELQERLELKEADLRRKLREYSTGMKRKLGLMQALQAEPPLLILDEPTDGLDPLMQEAFYELLQEARGKGQTVFMSSHVLSEVERICDRIALLRGGELALLSTVAEVRKLAPRRITVVFREDVTAAPTLPGGHKVVGVSPRCWQLEVEGALGNLVSILSSLPVEDIQIEQPRLEDVLVKYYGGGPK